MTTIDFGSSVWLQPYTWANIALVIFIFMTVIFSLLVFRQARQMTQVLPTRLSPSVYGLVIVFILITALAAFLGVGILVSTL